MYATVSGSEWQRFRSSVACVGQEMLHSATVKNRRQLEGVPHASLAASARLP